MTSPTDIAKGAGNLALKVASGDVLDVRSFTVEEGISSLFTVTLEAMSSNADIDFDAVVGQPARFTIHHDTHERFWSGVCNTFQQLAVEESEQGLSTYHLTIVPRLWFATQRRNYKMFQQMSEPDIVKKILKEWNIKPEEKLTGTYKKRKYRVQYAESDYAFIRRMLEDAGISFYFAQVEGKTKLILSDAPHLNEPRTPKLPFRDNPKTAVGEYVTRVRIGQQVRPGRYTMRDHDYRRPASYKLLASAEQASVDAEKMLERYHYAPGAFLFGTDKGDDTPTADDKGKARTDEAEAAILAQKRLDAKRGSAKVCTFETNAIDLGPGVVMSMQHHPRSDLGAKKRFLIVSATHAGTSQGDFTHHCEARSTDVPYRPPLTTPKPKISGVESATVVGPPGEEIHTDEFGRVRVHFHWDRDSKMDDNSSCWIHVSQPWGGAGYGGVNLPRVGQEVLVDFLGGDPDRPIITGRVYTNLQKVPYKLPASKTQSGWKSESSPGGGGFNELRFEDAKGKEQVYMQAEKDLKRLTKNNEDITVGNNLTKQVVNNEREVTGQNRSIVVGVNRSAQIGSIDSTMVGDTHVVMISPPGEGGGGSTSATMKDKKIVFDTGAGATITMEGSKITLVASNICVWAKNAINITSANKTNVGGIKQLTLGAPGGEVIIKGGPMVKINP